jgi:hypothetical protein
MEIELLVVADCPKAEPALRLVLDVLAELRLGQVRPRVIVIGSAGEAAERGFTGSPTILLDGTDPFADPALLPGLACRVYPGPSGLPSPSELRDALGRAG